MSDAITDAEISALPANYEFPDALSGNEWLKLRDWFADPARKRATSAFTAGAARDAATAFEAAVISEKERYVKLRSAAEMAINALIKATPVKHADVNLQADAIVALRESL
jgi:hypothetical protein